MNVAALLDRQRHVNECLKDEMEQIHALQMKTWTVEQYEKKKSASA
jgi:stress-induced morphogen